MRPVAVLIFILITAALHAQQKMTLEQCIQFANEHNIQLKMQELSVISAEQSKMQAKAMFLPSLNASALQTYSSGRSVDPYTNEFKDNETSRSDNFSLQSSVVLFQGLRNQYSYKQSSYNLTASLYDLEKARNDLSLNIASAFLQVLLTDEVFKNARQSLLQSEKQLGRTRSLYEANAIAESTLLEMEAQYARDEMQVTTAGNQYSMAVLTLKQLLEFTESEELQPDAPLLSDPEVKNTLYTTDYIYEQAAKALPQVLAAENREKASEAGLKMAKGARSPRLTMSAAYSTGYSDLRKSISGDPVLEGFYPNGSYATDSINLFPVYTPLFSYSYSTKPYNDQIRDNASKSLSFNLTIPIFNNWQVNNSVAQAKIGMLNSRYSKDLVMSQLKKEISQALADAKAALSQFEMSKKVYNATAEAFRSTEKRFENGLVNPVEYNLAKTNLDKASSDLIQSKYLLIFREKVLDFYLGNPIKL
jgi:outer membrane protein